MNKPADTIFKDTIHLTGLRGLAILLVLSGHLFSKFYIFNFGWIGLNLFFVLSGYLITGRLFYHLQQTPSAYFKNFYARRVLRIFPLYYGCLIIFFLFGPLLYKNYFLHFSSIYQEQKWYWLYISNWWIILRGLPENPIFFHFWSLAVEEQFYLLWPVIFILLKGKRRYFFILFMIIISIGVRIATDHPGHSYYSTLTASEPLLLGAMLSILQQENRFERYAAYLPFAFLVAIGGLSLIFYINADLHISNVLLMKYGYSAINLFWVALLFAIVLNNGKHKRIREAFQARWLVWLGKYSYGIYVFHWIVLQVFVNGMEPLTPGWGLGKVTSYLVVRLLAVVITLLLSMLSYHLYEKHFLRLKQYFNN